MRLGQGYRATGHHLRCPGQVSGVQGSLSTGNQLHSCPRPQIHSSVWSLLASHQPHALNDSLVLSSSMVSLNHDISLHDVC